MTKEESDRIFEKLKLEKERQQLKDIYISPEAMLDIKNWDKNIKQDKYEY
jgi:hypothetical protein